MESVSYNSLNQKPLKKKIMKMTTSRCNHVEKPSQNEQTHNRAYVLEKEGLSVVPYFKKSQSSSYSDKFQWSVNSLTKQPTITRKENFANGRWSEVPSDLVLPSPPIEWLTDLIKDDESNNMENDGIVKNNDEKESKSSHVKETLKDSGYYEDQLIDEKLLI